MAKDLTIVQTSARVIDPHAWTDARDLLNIRSAVFEPLVRPDWAGGHTAALAQKWITEDARSWTFMLRRDVRFHDGRPMRADDVVAALDRARNPSRTGALGTGALYRTYLADAAITRLSEHRVSLVTSNPMADLLDVLAEIPIVTDTGGSSAAGICGTGPYKVVEIGTGLVVMDAVRDYWAGTPYFSRLVWCADDSEKARTEAVLAGRADVATELSGRATREFEPRLRSTAIVSPTSVCVILMCNATSGVCVDRRVRQALNYALDVPAIIEFVRQGAATPLNGALTRLHLGYDPATPEYEYDPTRARALLEAAGHEHGLEVVLDIPTTIPNEAPVLAAMLAEQYHEVGIAVRTRTFTDRPAYAEMVKAKRMDDLACFDSTPVSSYRIMREKFHAGIAGPWWQGYRNAEVDYAIDEASATPDLARRRSLYRHAFRLVRDDAPWVFLYSPHAVTGVGPRAQELTVEPQGILRFVER